MGIWIFLAGAILAAFFCWACLRASDRGNRLEKTLLEKEKLPHNPGSDIP